MHSPGNGQSTRSQVTDQELSPGQARVPLWNNFLTMSGLFITATGIMLLLTYGLFSLVTTSPNPYGAIVAYMVVPCILVVGVALMPLGILLKSWRLHRRNAAQPLAFRFPRVDLTDPKQRTAAKIVVLASFVLLPVVGFSGYHGYRYTDTTAFCAKTCHDVMHPESTTHQMSAHAQVACAECHLGSRSSWFVKSKLSGMPQVMAVLRGSYPRPIPAAIAELRPTRDNCTQCHWPEKFFGAQLKKVVRFSSDERNTPRHIDMLLRIGGYETTDRNEGIHAHMALADRIEYVASDEALQDIPWVKFTDEAGTPSIYRADGLPHDAPPPAGQLRRFDCMDCHNRPAHRFRSPEDAVDIYLSTGRIDRNLPFIKREAVSALVGPHIEPPHAEGEIESAITGFYRTNYADEWETLATSVSQAVEMVREIHRHNFFDDMNVDWRTYANHIGHRISPGCFRCHDDRHVNQHGEAISGRCDLCHTFIEIKGEYATGAMASGGAFVHSFDLEGSHGALRCDECHDGGVSPLLTCARCHEGERAGGTD